MHLQLLLDMAASGHGDRIVVGPRGRGLSAADLRDRALTAARAITDSGADAVLYLAVNGPAFPVALFGAALAGVPLVPVNFRLGSEQLDRLLANHRDAYGIADEGSAAAALSRSGIASRTPGDFLASTAGGAAAATLPDPEEGRPAALIYTSGTTSTPKAVVLEHDNLMSYVLGTVEYGAADDDAAALISVPPYHIAAVMNVLTNLYAGRRLVVLQDFGPAEWLDTVVAEGITNAMVVPTMLARILDSFDGHDVPSLRTVAYGGAPMPTKVIEQALRVWPDVDFVNAYGLTETSSTISVLSPEDHRSALASDDPAVRARLGSAGRPLPSVNLEIRAEDGTVLPAGETGRIFVSGDQVSARYVGVTGGLDDRGFLDTRDEGRLDADGYLFIAGRADDTIIRGAENIAPAEIEEVMFAHPAVADVVVLGVPDTEWGQVIEAAVVLAPDASATADDIRAYVRTRLRSSKTPGYIVFWDELPRTDTGKILRRNALERLLRSRAPSA